MPIVPIVSLADPRVEAFHGVADPAALRRSNRFVAEGRLVVERLVDEAVSRHRYTIEALLLSDTALHAMEVLIGRIPAVPVYVCAATEFKALAGLNLHRGCLALARRPAAQSVADVIAHATTVIVLETIADPDNLGGIFRNASAFGADAVLLSPGCADPLYRKAIRTSMAAALRVPFAGIDDWPGGLQALRSAGFQLWAMTPHAPSRDLADDAGDRRPDRVALLLGAEGPGLSAPVLAMADERLRIAISADVDSLNVAVASGIALWRLATRHGLMQSRG